MNEDILVESLQLRYDNVEYLDAGGFGKIYKAINKNNGRKVALKILDESSGSLSISSALKEAMRTCRLNHPNIVKVYDAEILGVQNNILIIEMELLQENLSKKLLKVTKDFNEIPKVKENILLQILQQITSALVYLKEEGIVHRDIKPENILIRKFDQEKEEMEVVLTDFGLAKSKANNSFISYAGTESYLAPEVMEESENGEFKFSHASDIFALGVTLYRLMTKDMRSDLGHSYLTLESDDAFVKFVNKKYATYKCDTFYSREWLDLIIKMLIHVDNRIAVEDLSEALIEFKNKKETIQENTLVEKKSNEFLDNYGLSDMILENVTRNEVNVEVKWTQTSKSLWGCKESYKQCEYQVNGTDKKVFVFVAKASGSPPNSFNTNGYNNSLHCGCVEKNGMTSVFFVIHPKDWAPYQHRFGEFVGASKEGGMFAMASSLTSGYFGEYLKYIG